MPAASKNPSPSSSSGSAPRPDATPAYTYSPEAAQAWIQAHWHGGKACPLCAANHWSISPELLAIPMARQSVPLAAMTCLDCGYMMLFNAVVAGFVPAKDGTP